MTNYFGLLGLTLFLASACSAAEKPPAPAAAKVAAVPDGTKTAPAPAPAAQAAAPAAALPSFVQAPAGSSLTFSFEQAGATNQGAFKQFTTTLTYDEKNLQASKLQVKVQIASLATQDKDRDDTLASPDLFDAKKFPTAQYVASSLAKRADGSLEAAGKLTLRGVTKDVRVPLKITATAAGLELAGEITIKRLDYGIGQGEWKSTEWVGDAVQLQYKVALVKAAAAAAR